MSTGLPIPPPDLLQRIGPMGEENPAGVFEETGRLHRELLESVLPSGWSWPEKRVLDFGCGIGRMLRQFAPESGEAEFWGCDLDRSSIEWLAENLSPPFHVFESSEAAGLPQEDGYFDLIYAFSVYTHFTDNWAAWLLEHHRVLADNGLLFATFLGEGMLEPLTGEKWDENRIGMNPLMHGYPWDLGGPIAINSPWWIRAHWGRAFDILELVPRFGEDVPSHGVILARKKPVQLDVADLTRLDPDEPREIAALLHHVEQLSDEVRRLHTSHELLQTSYEGLETSHKVKDAQLRALESSRSWQLTAPLRAAKRLRARSQ